MVIITDRPIDPKVLMDNLKTDGAGSVVSHVGVVKANVEGRKSGGIKFRVAGDLEGEIAALEKELRERFNLVDAVMMRRVGDLRVGDVIMAVAFSSEGRDAAFGACREAVERFKKFRNISKVELFE